MRATLWVNGVTRSVEVEPRRLLADVLREEFGCHGVHFGCSHGACGCCTVHVNGVARLSCLTFAVQCDGDRITTIEGLGQAAGADGDVSALHPLQESFIREHGLQCGYCTPGYIMALAPFVAAACSAGTAVPDEAAIREAMSGNLCRCTGYQTIVNAVRDAITRGRLAGGEEHGAG
jgi:aerobic-type carbon monoxide dehydrogenase small subunit (CoxS/CutS family)